MRTAGMTEPISGRQTRDPRWVNFLTPENSMRTGGRRGPDFALFLSQKTYVEKSY